MSVPDILYTLLIGPLETLFQAIYTLTYTVIENPGLSIVGLSLVMNLLLLPLYQRTDAIQLEAIETEKRLRPYVAHIKKTFKGNEQFMMLQTCYRQNHYKPTDALKGISPLMLEIPFFMAAYHFLSGLALLQGASLGPVENLGAPDGLLKIGGLSINVLPVLMTVINVISSLIYTKDAPLKTKLQLYGMAALFLVLLYDSPAGLAFYWTLNNLFSLVKNALMKTKKPLLVVSVLSGAAGIVCAGYTALRFRSLSSVQIGVFLTAAILLWVPMAVYLLRGRCRGSLEKTVGRRDVLSFFTAGLLLTLLVGLLIPSALIRTSPEEFIVVGSGINPNSYLLYTGLICAGFFLIWLGLFYMLARPGGKKIMELALWLLCAGAIVNYMGFGRHYGVLSSQLRYDEVFHNSVGEILLNLAALLVTAVLVWLLWAKKPGILRVTGLAAAIAMVGMSAANIGGSQKILTEKMKQIEPPSAQVSSLFRLSKTGKNVIILMMDRGVSGFVPYIFEEKPELKSQFAGFTYYPNTLSFGSHTNVGLPSVFGGYEYTPLEMNRRSEESLESKHNEALKVLPVLFDSRGFETTVCDPTYAGYDWIPDLSVFRDYPQISTHITMGHYNELKAEDAAESMATMQHRFLFYGIFKSSPVLLHSYLYDGGSYHGIARTEEEKTESTVRGEGISDAFLNSYNVLRYLPKLTEITQTPENTFLMMCNDTAHSPQLLQLPDYLPMQHVDNSRLDKKHPERTDGSGDRIVMEKPIQVQHYHCNMAGYLQIGRWLDYLRENGVYDNTRIVIVSDHGYNVHIKEAYEFGSGYWDEDIMFYNPVLMVKDFDSTDFETDETFMTNADVPTLITEGVIPEPVNPFTGKKITSDAKKQGVSYVFASHQWDVSKNHGNTYLPDRWLEVQGDMKNKNNWVYIDESQLP